MSLHHATEAARMKVRQINMELALWRAMRPDHARKYAHHSREWMEACDRAFQLAMAAHPDERPGFHGLVYNAAGSAS